MSFNTIVNSILIIINKSDFKLVIKISYEV